MKQRVAAGEFKAKCLRLIEEVRQSGKEIVITKRGKPVARLVAMDKNLPEAFGWMAGTGRIVGDIISPIDVKWDAER